VWLSLLGAPTTIRIIIIGAIKVLLGNEPLRDGSPRGEPRRTSGGRPTAEAVIRLEATILDQATAAFLADGFAATTIEGIAKSCRVAKRTIYARWSGKPALFCAVVERLLAEWLREVDQVEPEAETLANTLDKMAQQMLSVALKPEVLALHRLLVAEAGRFPELPGMIRQVGGMEGLRRVTAVLDYYVASGELPKQDTSFAAEQFMHLVLTGPQRRALGLVAPSLNPDEVRDWGRRAVAIFLRSVHMY
jgi:TetR/AcrR family transcriptional regulator, mexJK operon transcriptional repressor